MKAFLAAFGFVAFAVAVRDLPPATTILDGHYQEDEETLLGDVEAPCQVARRITAWHYKLNYKAATSVDLSNRYVLQADANCNGEVLAPVIIMPEIDPLRPHESSSASLLFESRADPFKLPETSYVCEAPHKENGADIAGFKFLYTGCLAVIQNAVPPWGPRLLLRYIPSGPFQSELEDDADPATRLGLDILAVLMLTVALLTLLVICYLLCVALLLCRSETKPVSFRRSEEDAVQVQSPWSDLRSGCLQVTAYVFSVITLQGLSLQLSKKDASDFVLLMTLFWPCTFGMAGILRMFQTLCHAQLVHAALGHGVCVQGGVSSSFYNAVIGLGFVVLFVCIVCCLTLSNLGRTAIFSVLGTVVGLYMGPTVTMGKALVSVARTDKAIRSTHFPVSLAGLVKLMITPADDEERTRLQSSSPLPLSQTLSSTACAAGSLDQKLRDGQLHFMQFHYILQQCRRGHDPFEAPDADADADANEMSTLGLTDFFRHGRIIHQLTGSMAGYLIVPIIVVFLLGVFVSTACRSVIYLTGPPALLELTTTSGHMMPAFQPRQQHYAVILGSHWGNVGVFALADAYSTRYLNYSVPDSLSGRHHGGVDGSVKLINVDTSRAPFPHFASVTVTGARGMTRSYVIHFLPAKTLATSVRLRTGTFSRCIPWSSVPGAAISLPDMLADAKLKVDIALSDYMLRVPVLFSTANPKMNREVTTTWYPYKAAGAEICKELCRYDTTCLDALHGIDGCFFASSPFDTDNCHLAHIGHSNYGRRHWWAQQATGRLQASRADIDYTEARADRHWRLHFPELVPEWFSHQTEFIFRLFLAADEQQIATEVQTLLLHRGTQSPLELLVQVMGNKTASDKYTPLGATVEITDSTSVMITLPEYNVTDVGDTLSVLVAPLLRDFAFEADWINTTGLSLEVLEDLGTWGAFQRCKDVSSLRRYDVCGGTWRSKIALLRLNSWEPNQKATLDVVGKLGYDFFFEPVTVTVQIQGHKGQQPAEWMVRKDCHLPGDKITSLNLLTPRVTCSALQNCAGLVISNLPVESMPFDRDGLLQRALWKFGMTDSRDAARLLLCSHSMTARQRLLGWGLCAECERLPCLCMRPWAVTNGHVIRLPMRVLVEEARPKDGRFVYFFCRRFWDMKFGPLSGRYGGEVSLQLWDEVLVAAVRGGARDIVNGLSYCLRRVRESPLQNLSGATVPEAVRVAVTQRRSDLLQPLMEAWTGHKSPVFRKELLFLAIRAHCMDCLDVPVLHLDTFRTLAVEEELPEASAMKILAAALTRMPALMSVSISMGWLVPAESVLEVVEALAHLKELTFLAIPSAFSGKVLQHLCQVLKVMPALKSLRLDRSHIDDDEAMLLAEALNQLPRLTQVQLQGNRIGNAGAEAIIEAMRHCPRMTNESLHLDLTGNRISASDKDDFQVSCPFCIFHSIAPDLPYDAVAEYPPI
mmetsp:Transcript_34722/g.79601  ORF Transcript_34722/g.79601 Transcript_34722/m.79601 type:complete len:1440 (+) Transcript_34722:175-4494(+)